MEVIAEYFLVMYACICKKQNRNIEKVHKDLV